MPMITLSYSEADGQRLVTLERPSTSLGRSPDRDIVLNDPLVSRQHAVIAKDGEAWTVADQNSTHGTYLNSARIEQATLKPGDVLQLGSLRGVKLHVGSEQADKPTAWPDQDSLSGLLSSMEEITNVPEEGSPGVRVMEQLSWLLGAARKLNDGVGIDEILRTLLQLSVQLTGVERGFVYLWSERTLHFAQGIGMDGRSLEEDQSISRKAIQEALQSKSKFSISDTSQDQVASGWSSVMLNEIRSIYCIPLRVRVSAGEGKSLLGLLYLDSRIKSGSMTEIDHQLLDVLSAEAAALLHNALLAEAELHARRAREELAIAARIHSGLMSRSLPVVPYAVIQARSVPCLAIGGDFYDAVALEDCLCATIVDVSGKGVAAAIVAATLQGIIHAQLAARQSLPEIAAAVNQFLCERNVGKYATMVLLKLFPDGRVEYVNCGHLLPLVIWGKQVRRLEVSNMVVGLLSDAGYVAGEDWLQPGERLLLATDGITEAENSAGNQFEESWLGAVTHCRNIGEILDQVAQFQAPNPAQDDCTLVEVRYEK